MHKVGGRCFGAIHVLNDVIALKQHGKLQNSAKSIKSVSAMHLNDQNDMHLICKVTRYCGHRYRVAQA